MLSSRSLEQVKQSVSEKGKVAFVSGKFNVVHPGHLRLFRFAREISDHLIVGVYSDGSVDDLLLPETDRLEGVLSNYWVDDAFILRQDLPDTIMRLQPEIVVKGKEHENIYNSELMAVQEYGGVVHFVSGDTRFSSVALLQAELGTHSKVVTHANKYLSRRGVSFDNLRSIVSEMLNVRTLVIGDLIVDRYIDCEPIGMSAEDPTVVVTPLLNQEFIGGAGIVSAHASSLGKLAHLISVCGDDEAGKSVRKCLSKVSVDARIIHDQSRPTTIKSRYRARGQTLLRVNDFRDHEVDKKISERIVENALDLLPEVDLVLFSDFGYGMLSQEVIDQICNAGRKQSLLIGADSQTSSQMGDITRFNGITLLTPTEKEARLAVRDKYGGLVQVAEKLQALAQVDNVILTLAGEGLFLRAPNLQQSAGNDDRIPALNHDPKDVAGAGDAFLVGAALALAAGADIWMAAYIGSIASACQVNRVGNLPLKTEEIFQELSP